MFICPWSNAPEQVFVPAYVPCSCVIMSSMSNVPVAVALHVPDIIDPPDMVIVNDPVVPFIMPDTIIVPPLCPPTCIVPENVLPVCVIAQVVPPIMEPDDPPPIIDPLESDALPTHVPAIVLADVGFMGEDMVPPQPAAASAVATLRVASNRIALLLLFVRRGRIAGYPACRLKHCGTCKSLAGHTRYRRDMVIWPLLNDPAQEFVPL